MTVVRRYTFLLCAIGMALFVSAAQAAEDSLLFDAPKLDGIAVDGSAGDWGNRGLMVGVMTTPEGALRSPENFDAGFRLGWDERGLLLLVTVRDNAPVETSSG